MPFRGRGQAANGYAAVRSAQTPMPQWASQLFEALAAAEQHYQPEKAMQVVQVMEHLPQVQQRIAAFYTALGRRSVDMVELPPHTADFFLKLGLQQHRQHNALQEAMAACKKSVQDRINRIVGQRQKDQAWDVKGGMDGWH